MDETVGWIERCRAAWLDDGMHGINDGKVCGIHLAAALADARREALAETRGACEFAIASRNDAADWEEHKERIAVASFAKDLLTLIDRPPERRTAEYERARIVEWLRDTIATPESDWIRVYADAIEAGEHWRDA